MVVLWPDAEHPLAVPNLCLVQTSHRFSIFKDGADIEFVQDSACKWITSLESILNKENRTLSLVGVLTIRVCSDELRFSVTTTPMSQWLLRVAIEILFEVY